MSDLKHIILPPEVAFDEAALKSHLLSKKIISTNQHFELVRRSIDARQKKIKVNLSIAIHEKDNLVKEDIIATDYQNVSTQPSFIIVGAGPAGLFAALKCLELGIKPIVLERGKDVRARRRDLAAITKEHIVNAESNYCFGEGGAGTYSDGKLYTRSKKKGDLKKILKVLVEQGAPQDILIDAHPHIGTNKLPKIIQSIRETIVAHGGEVRFDAKVEDIIIHNQKAKGVKLACGNEISGEGVLLATGHSARDIFELLYKKNIQIHAKPFALGVRVEHPQEFINTVQYHGYDTTFLPSASYKLVSQEKIGKYNKGVFSFCMCPGGYIVPAATQQGEVVVNGMSPSRRNSKFANSGIVVEVNKHDWKAYEKEHGALAGLRFQEEIEKKACKIAGNTQKAPAQRLTDFIKGVKSIDLPETSYKPGLTSVNMKEVLPEHIHKSLVLGFQSFNKKIKGFLSKDAVIVGVESRTSSPVSIPRDPISLQHPDIEGLFPCGEGAGYAGGIVSAAIDGERCAKAFEGFFRPS